MLTLSLAIQRQNGPWNSPRARRTVVLVEDQQSEFKRSLAPNLLVLRLAAGYSSQRDLARDLTKKGAVVSEATVRRWEDPDSASTPDAWQLNRLCEILDCAPKDLVQPEALTDREREIARRVARSAIRGRDRGLQGG